MCSKTRGLGCSQSCQTQAEKDLLQILLQEEGEPVYYWNPIEPESESYFAQLEQEFTLDDWLEEDIERRSQSFFNQLDEIWAVSVPVVAENNLLVALQEKFAVRVPLSWLETISRNALQLKRGQDYTTQGMSLADRLVQCVRELVSGWPEGDLYLFSRPLAFAMRGTESQVIESVLGTVRPLPFAELSELEQARLSLAIACYALTELDRQ